MDIRPLSDNILVRVLPKETHTESGLALPGAFGRPNKAEVLAVSDKVFDLEPGDQILFDPYKVKILIEDGRIGKQVNTPAAVEGTEALIPEAAVLVVL